MHFSDLQARDIQGGDHISSVLDDLARFRPPSWPDDFRTTVSRGLAFVTFAFDIDGVSMEILKYGQCFERILPGVPIHCIAGTFGDKADVVMQPNWHRHQLAGADGWDKWDGGRWFTRLFYEDLPPGGTDSSELAQEIWSQALSLAERLVAYIEQHDIGLLFTVNTNSNPGNVAFALAIVLASETTDCAVINNNHDFYWEGGKAGCKRNPGELPGPRDHFFRNHDNEEFFGFFQRVYPWNGRRWTQVNINSLQTRRLIDRLHFHPDDVFTIGTGLNPEFFGEPPANARHTARQRMSKVLGGDAAVNAEPVDEFRERVSAWMHDQRPVVLGRRAGSFDMTADSALYLLQPTRVVARKRIWRDWDMIAALLRHPPFQREFEQRQDLTLTLHVTGPVPIEHQLCLERVLDAFCSTVVDMPSSIADRLFLAFSAGWQTAPTLDQELGIVDIYRLADLVVFPSQTEGRGLPIAEAAAAGVPIVCSHYDPPAVFAEVVGLHLHHDEQILYEDFPEADFSDELLERVTATLLDPQGQTERIAHNRAAAVQRYSLDVLTASIDGVLERLEQTTGSS